MHFLWNRWYVHIVHVRSARIRPGFDQPYLFLYINKLGFISHTACGIQYIIDWHTVCHTKGYITYAMSHSIWLIFNDSSFSIKHACKLLLLHCTSSPTMWTWAHPDMGKADGKTLLTYLLNFHFCFFYHLKFFFSELVYSIFRQFYFFIVLARQQNFKTWTKLRCTSVTVPGYFILIINSTFRLSIFFFQKSHWYSHISTKKVSRDRNLLLKKYSDGEDYKILF